ncbi:virulence-associated E family protein [Aestuariicella sp. G3-2]|uniref:virulence-associated E family protein n=1 Tax=Pseudomaricurvus albidus TaxID=2842452 RepID=UPI001C0AD4EE|nr:virulence-associated E family protein [Aestuariicella albida]MBU3069392.1 virulence-associated E family protein [Aestuariicella albida]
MKNSTLKKIAPPTPSSAIQKLKNVETPEKTVPDEDASHHPTSIKETKPNLCIPLAPNNFPDQKLLKSGDIVLLPTIANVLHLLKGYEIEVFYDVIGKRIQILIPGLKASPENYHQIAITTLTSLAGLCGMPTKGLLEFVAVIADQHRVNPVAEWIQKKPWDGKNRLPELFETLTVSDDYPVELRDIIVYRFLASAVAAAFEINGFSSRLVLVLRGPQSIGKTSWIQSLAPADQVGSSAILLGHHLDLRNKDTIITSLQHWLVELGELDSTLKASSALFKAFITNPTDKLRLPYARSNAEYPRRTIFAASVNDANYLIDDTGNSRFGTIDVSAISYQHGIDMQQLFAQIHEKLKSGDQWWLTKDEEKLLTEYNRRHMSVSSLREQLMEQLDLSIPESDRRKLSATQVLQMMGYLRPSNPQCRECGGILRDLLGEPKKINGTVKWAVPIVAPAL